MVFLAGWSSLQSNTLATIYAQEGIRMGYRITLHINMVYLQGGAQRVGLLSKLVQHVLLVYLSAC
jgi:hypothetical protein